jgi:1,4-alpha-glucan branching enzyme
MNRFSFSFVPQRLPLRRALVRVCTVLCILALHLSAMLTSTTSANAQIVQVTPPFPTSEDSVTVIFDATQGTGGLRGISPVYAHTGVVTNLSNDQWRYVVAPWGTDTPKIRMTPLGNDRHSLSFQIRSYYGVPTGEEVRRLAFVFRNANGSAEGKGTGGTDIFYTVYPSGMLFAKFLAPAAGSTFYAVGDTVRIRAASSLASSLAVNAGTASATGSQIGSATNSKEIAVNYVVPAAAAGTSVMLRLVATQGGQTLRDSVSIFVRGTTPVAELPAGVQDGINYVNDSTAVLVLFAPGKQFGHLLGDFNDWQITSAGTMNRTPDGSRLWVRLTGLVPRREYGFQYLIEGALRLTDPYAEKILDPFNDPQVVREGRYPNLLAYPTNKTTGMVGVLQTAQTPYPWKVQNFKRPAKKDLVVYELLVRDFSDRRTFRAVIDSLGYLKRLGINCIELMPVTEFDGNLSWGYNPAFFCAVDKFYGTENDLRQLVDSAHALGIAVVADMVFNHATGSCPLYQLYSANENPYFNVVARHPFNVFNDINHEYAGTQAFFDRVNRFWLQRYRLDGFRYDLSKGFTQVNSGSDVSGWSRRDTSRIRLLKRMADQIWRTDSTAYVILEHFADNSEETELANYGMMLWGNLNFNYNEATMGYERSDFSWIWYRNRNWNQSNVFGYMESHDEERLMFKNIQFGNRTGTAFADYTTRDTTTALQRMKLAATFFFTIPGPKMIWQFGELGFDYSINWPSLNERDRLTIKPSRWDYYDDSRRRSLFNVYAELTKLKTTQPVFGSDNVSLGLSGLTKRINISHPTNNVTIVGNFGIMPASVTPNFQRTGTWNEFYTRRTLNVTDTQATLTLQPGEFAIYSTTPFPAPVPGLATSVRGAATTPPALNGAAVASPNPASGGVSEVTVAYNLARSEEVSVVVTNVLGETVATLARGLQSAGEQRLAWMLPVGIPNGVYVCRIQAGATLQTLKIVVMD